MFVCFVPLLELGAKIRQNADVEKKLLSLGLASCFSFSCLIPLSYTIVIYHCLSSLLQMLVVLYHCLILLSCCIVLVILSDSSDAVSDLWQKRTLLPATNTLIYSMITLRFCQMWENVRYSCRKSDKNHTLNRHFSATSPLAILYALDDFSNV